MIADEYSINRPSSAKKRKISGIAKERWKLLAQILQGGRTKDTWQNTVSIRRFNTFGLFNVQKLTETKQSLWQEYKSNHSSNFKLQVRQLCGNIKPDKLQGFNNTGNICIWPAEEIMSYYCLKNPQLFKNKSVIEIGGGMTCLAGFSIAVSSEAKLVQVTDGNTDSVKNLDSMVERNKENYGKTQVHSSLFRWGPDKLEASLQEKFDVVLCSDCLFFEEGREDLIQSMYNLLQPQGEVLVFAPTRGDTFTIFSQLVEERFYTETEANYDDRVWKLHCQFKENSLYDEDIHYPLLLKMMKKQVD